MPAPLPPSPPVEWSHELQDLLEIANRGVGRLDGASRIEGALGTRKALTALRVHDVFTRKVATSIPAASKATGLTPPAVSSAIEALEKLGIVREVTALHRNRQFLYSAYLAALEEG